MQSHEEWGEDPQKGQDFISLQAYIALSADIFCHLMPSSPIFLALVIVSLWYLPRSLGN